MSVIVTTQQGQVEGAEHADGSQSFKGVPYAAPPVGELRLRRSIPHSPWDGVLDCSQFRACSLQGSARGMPGDAELPGGIDEDCLYLNVWAPARAGDELLPVFLWIHGGAFLRGSGSEPLYDGARLAAKGCVVVIINYRLGALGFMWPETGDANCGLWDQVRALQWLHENIEAFGGDASQITVGGESAGAISVACLVASPVANVLFNRAVLMSAIGHSAVDEQTAKLISQQFANALGAASTRAEDLQDLNVDDWLATQNGERDSAPDQDFYVAVTTPGWLGPPLKKLAAGFEAHSAEGICYRIAGDQRSEPLPHSFGPVIDGELLLQPPLDALAAGVASHITLLIGSNREETGFRPFKGNPDYTAPLTYGARTDTLEQAVVRTQRFMQGWGRLDTLGGARKIAEELVYTYAEVESQGSGAAEQGSPQHIYNRLASDMAFNASTVMIAARQAQVRPDQVWVYRFEGFNHRNAFHGWELGLVFGTLLDTGNPATVALSESMGGALRQFIRCGDPEGAPNMPDWAPWQAKDADLFDGPLLHFDRSGCYVSTYREAAPGIGMVVSVLDAAMPHVS